MGPSQNGGDPPSTNPMLRIHDGTDRQPTYVGGSVSDSPWLVSRDGVRVAANRCYIGIGSAAGSSGCHGGGGGW